MRRGRVITCELAGSGEQTYDVWIVPHWDVEASLVQCFGSRPEAMQRYSEMVAQLETAGWTRVSEADLSTLTAA